MRSIGRYIFVGVLTAAPLTVTWLIVDFLFTQLSRMGRPPVTALAFALAPTSPTFADWLLDERLQSIVAVAIVLAFFYLLGWATTRVVGQRLIGAFERLVARIPLIQTIYSGTKKFLRVASATPDKQQRVVLINFPSSEMRAIGFVTRTLADSATGEELAAVYVPTAPNPTSGYVEIVPMRSVTFTEWTFDQAMAFVVTGGSSSPESVRYSDTAAAEPAGPGADTETKSVPKGLANPYIRPTDT